MGETITNATIRNPSWTPKRNIALEESGGGCLPSDDQTVAPASPYPFLVAACH